MKVMSRSEYQEQVQHPKGERDAVTFLMDRGIMILADDGRPLYELRLDDDGVSLEIRTPSVVEMADGRIIQDNMLIMPLSYKAIILQRSEDE